MSAPAACRLIVFDLDGTLVDSRSDLAGAANALLVEEGCVPRSEEAIGRMVGDGAATLVARAFAAAGCPPPAHALKRFLELYDARLLAHTRPYDGVETLLATLEARVPLAILTNKPTSATRAILDGLDLSRYFRAGIIGGDGPVPRKPDPAGLRHLMQAAGVTSRETLLVGDSRVDCATAHAADTRICLVRYGFGSHDVTGSDLRESDFAVDKAEDLFQAVRNRYVLMS